MTAGTSDEPFERTPQRVTIREVARKAGVSVSTVSLALADSPLIATDTKRKVREAAAALRYRPSALGRALQSRRTNSVALHRAPQQPARVRASVLHGHPLRSERGAQCCRHDVGAFYHEDRGR